MTNNPTPATRRTLLFVANTDWYLLNFRLNLLRAARDAGWMVALACPRREHAEMLEKEGFLIHHIPFDTVGLKPWREAQSLLSLRRLFRQLEPDVIHLFTLKCVLYGCLVPPAQRNIQVIGAITGMGHLFTTKSWRTRLLKPSVTAALKLAIRRSNARIIFQNDADRDEFVAHRLVSTDRTTVIRGSGVDCKKFRPRHGSPRPAYPLRVLFCGRLIKEKGIREYLAATAELWQTGYDFHSYIAGAPYAGNPSSLTPEEVEQLTAETSHAFLGMHSDMAGLLANTDIVVLPTYREGTPKALLEAAASGCIIITTDIPGCHGIVEPGINGALVQPRDETDLTQSLAGILTTSPESLQAMREKSRDIALARFSDRLINSKTLAFYE